MQFTDYRSMHAMLKETVDRDTEKPAYKWFTEPGVTDSVTWGQFYDQVRAVAKSLMALGVEKGDKVNILSYSCYRWVLSDLGITIGRRRHGGHLPVQPPQGLPVHHRPLDAVVIFCRKRCATGQAHRDPRPTFPKSAR
jgi:long-subunit acyl-CoA synthetase (AMP-forming)